MDLLGTKFGRGPKELCGAADLVNQYKLWPYRDFFCKSSLPFSISETRYVLNVVGETETSKGEGMELNQLLDDTPYLRERENLINPFGLDMLSEAFHLRDSTPIHIPSAEKGTLTAAAKFKGEPEGKERKHQKQKNRDKDYKRHKHRGSDKIIGKEPSKNGHLVNGSEHLQKLVDKKRRHCGTEDPYDIQRHKKVQKWTS